MKNIIEKIALGAALLLAVIVGPALSKAHPGNQAAAAILAGGIDYSILNPLTRDQLVDVIKCLTDGSGTGLDKCVSRVTSQIPATSTPSTLTVSNPSEPIRASNYRINPFDGIPNVPMLAFNARSDNGASEIKSVQVIASGTAPTTLYLYDGATLLMSRAVTMPGTVITFDNISTFVQKDTMKTYWVKASYPSNVLSNNMSEVALMSVTYRQPNGTLSTVSPSGAIRGPVQHFYDAVAVTKLAGTPSITATIGANGLTSALTSVFPMTMQAIGRNVIMPSVTGTDFSVAFTNGVNTYYATNKSVVTIPQNDIADGSTANVTLTASAANSNLPTSGLYTSKITSISWNAVVASAYQTWGLEDFKTPYAAQFNK
jgi:hypothetical protein